MLTQRKCSYKPNPGEEGELISFVVLSVWEYYECMQPSLFNNRDS